MTRMTEILGVTSSIALLMALEVLGGLRGAQARSCELRCGEAAHGKPRSSGERHPRSLPAAQRSPAESSGKLEQGQLATGVGHCV